MNDTNLSISIPNKSCYKNCPYCIFKMSDLKGFINYVLVEKYK